MVFQINFIKKIILIIGLIFILFLHSTNKLVPTEYLNTLCLSFLIHLLAVVVSLDLFKYLKIPFTIYFSTLSLLTYGLSPFFVDKFDFQLGQLDYSIYNNLNFGFILFYLVYFINTYKKITNNKSIKTYFKSPKYSVKKLKYYFLFFYILSQFVNIPISAINEYIEFFLCGLFLIGFLKDNNKYYENIFLVIFISYISLKLLLTGLIYAIIYFAFYLVTIFIIFINFNFRKLFPVIIYFLFVFVFSIIYSSVKMEYRRLLNNAPTLYEKSILLKELVTEDLTFSYTSNEQKVKDGPIWRLSYPLSAFSQTTIMTPSIVPYWDGESYVIIIYKLIPRFLFPNKPTENMGQIFGHRYKFLSDDNLTTSMNTPILAEAYMNFGYLGFFVLIIIMAISFSSLFFNVNTKNTNNSELFSIISSIHIAILSVFFIQWESNFSMLVGKCLTLYILDNILKKIVFFKN